MKKAAFYITFFCYSSLMLRPVMPWVADVAAHVFFFKDHMMTVHSHNGKYHVHAEIAEAAKNTHSEKSTAVFRKDFPDSEPMITLHCPIFAAQHTDPILAKYFHEPIEDPAIQSHFPPPKAYQAV